MGCFKSQTTSTEGMQLETFHKENFISTAVKCLPIQTKRKKKKKSYT